jgi:hypothetical protein
MGGEEDEVFADEAAIAHGLVTFVQTNLWMAKRRIKKLVLDDPPKKKDTHVTALAVGGSIAQLGVLVAL